MLQEQISEFLGIKSFKRKYPDLHRRQVEMDEKEFLKEWGVVTETQCDLGLTALRADEVIDLMVRDYIEKYQVCFFCENEFSHTSFVYKFYFCTLIGV